MVWYAHNVMLATLLTIKENVHQFPKYQIALFKLIWDVHHVRTDLGFRTINVCFSFKTVTLWKVWSVLNVQVDIQWMFKANASKFQKFWIVVFKLITHVNNVLMGIDFSTINVFWSLLTVCNTVVKFVQNVYPIMWWQVQVNV